MNILESSVIDLTSKKVKPPVTFSIGIMLNFQSPIVYIVP